MFLPGCCWCWTGLAGGLYLVPLCPWTNLKAAQQPGTMGESRYEWGLVRLPPHSLVSSPLFPKAVQVSSQVLRRTSFPSRSLIHSHPPTRTPRVKQPVQFHFPLNSSFLSLLKKKKKTRLRSLHSALSICLAICVRARAGRDQVAVHERDSDEQR